MKKTHIKIIVFSIVFVTLMGLTTLGNSVVVSDNFEPFDDTYNSISDLELENADIDNNFVWKFDTTSEIPGFGSGYRNYNLLHLSDNLVLDKWYFEFQMKFKESEFNDRQDLKIKFHFNHQYESHAIYIEIFMEMYINSDGITWFSYEIASNSGIPYNIQNGFIPLDTLDNVYINYRIANLEIGDSGIYQTHQYIEVLDSNNQFYSVEIAEQYSYSVEKALQMGNWYQQLTGCLFYVYKDYALYPNEPLINPLEKLRVINTVANHKQNFWSEMGYVDEELILDLPDITPVEQTGTYWEYTAYSIEKDYDWLVEFTVKDVEYNYTYAIIKGKETDSKFYYDTTTLENSQLGNWIFEWGLLTIDFNWLRNSITWILNLIILVIEVLLFLLTIAFNYLILYIPCMFVIPFVWNVVFYYIIYALLYSAFYIWELVKIFGIWLWEKLVELWENVIKPFIIWLYENVFDIILDIVILAFSFILTALIWVLSLGQINFGSLFDLIVNMNENIADFLGGLFTVFADNIIPILLYIVYYTYLILFCYLKIQYVKSKGYVDRAEKLQTSLDMYMEPIRLSQSMIVFIKSVFF